MRLITSQDLHGLRQFQAYFMISPVSITIIPCRQRVQISRIRVALVARLYHKETLLDTMPVQPSLHHTLVLLSTILTGRPRGGIDSGRNNWDTYLFLSVTIGLLATCNDHNLLLRALCKQRQPLCGPTFSLKLYENMTTPQVVNTIRSWTAFVSIQMCLRVYKPIVWCSKCDGWYGRSHKK